MRAVIFTEIIPDKDGRCLNGIARHIQVLRSGLTSVGCQFHVVATNNKQKPGKGLTLLSGKPVSGGGSGYVLAVPTPSNIRLLFREIKGADVLHVHHPSSMAIIGALYARTRRIPVVFTWHTYYVEYAALYKKSDLVSEKTAKKGVRSLLRFLSLCSAIIAPSEAARRYAIRNGRLRDMPFFVIPTAVELPDSKLLTAEARAEFRKRLGIPENAVILTSSGRQGKEKGFETVVSAFGKIAGLYPKTHLVLAGGPGKITETLHKKTRFLRLENRVHFVGHLEKELPTLYADSVAVLSGSQMETQGLTIWEAAACGTPAIVPNKGGIAEQVRDGIDGFVCAPTAQAMSEALRALLSNKKLQESMGAAAREKVENYTPEDMAKKVVAVYEGLKQKKSKLD